jgi:glutamate--cysteine ligase catalytic subunit
VEEADLMEHVYADAMPYGMGSSCLQVTMQAANISESRQLYDQLAPLAPLLLALTAATPFMRGWICDDDTRWGQISQSVDDRTTAERGMPVSTFVEDPMLAGNGLRPLRKSRYDGVDCYIGKRADTHTFNDIPLAFDSCHVQKLVDGGVDETLARHVAHLFARDPLVIFADRIHLDDDVDIDHWENLQSTNWQTLRWKPPPPHRGKLGNTSDNHIGWRVEFRSMEIQMTDFENAAFIAFVVLLSRAILDLDVDLRVPISKVDDNMEAAQRRSACTTERFWFRQNPHFAEACEATCGLMSMNEIVNGSGSFEGLIPLCQRYMNTKHFGADTRVVMERYLGFIGQRAQGSLPTPATFMRDFVMAHPSYQQDSRVRAPAVQDLIVLATRLGDGQESCPALLGSFARQEPWPPSATPTCCPISSDEDTLSVNSAATSVDDWSSLPPSPSDNDSADS